MNPEKFTQKSIEAINQAGELAAERANPTVEPAHILLSLLKTEGGLIPELLVSMGADEKGLSSEIERIVDAFPRAAGGSRAYLSSDAEKLLRKADKKREEMRDDYLSVEHLMLAMFDEGGAKIKEIFSKYNVTRSKFLETLKDVRGNTRVTNENPEGTYDVLKKYGQDLVELAREKKLDPVIGRDDEIRNVIRILSRKSKNNPCLIGEPGVGKTAIAEGLAQRIVRGDVPDNLKDKKALLPRYGRADRRRKVQRRV